MTRASERGKAGDCLDFDDEEFERRDIVCASTTNARRFYFISFSPHFFSFALFKRKLIEAARRGECVSERARDEKLFNLQAKWHETPLHCV